ncbi:MAG: hypothetical protein QM723_21765 [Myxococcaceae bacterium]
MRSRRWLALVALVLVAIAAGAWWQQRGARWDCASASENGELEVRVVDVAADAPPYEYQVAIRWSAADGVVSSTSDSGTALERKTTSADARALTDEVARVFREKSPSTALSGMSLVVAVVLTCDGKKTHAVIRSRNTDNRFPLSHCVVGRGSRVSTPRCFKTWFDAQMQARSLDDRASDIAQYAFALRQTVVRGAP